MIIAIANQKGGVGKTTTAVRDGDIITIDAIKNILSVELTEAQIAERMQGWQAPPSQYHPTSVLSKYARLVSSASEGAITQ